MSLRAKGYGLVKVIVIIIIISILITIANNEYSNYINKTNLTTDALYNSDKSAVGIYINKYKNFGKTSLDFNKNELLNELAPPNGIVINKYIKWISSSEIKIIHKISLSGKYK